MSTRITDEVAGWVGETLDARLDESDIRYEVGLVPIPTGPNQMTPGLAITLVVKHILIGQTLTAQAAMPSVTPTKEAIADVVNQTLDQLLQARSKAAAEANGHGSGDNVLRMP